MTKEEIIELARQAGFERLGHDDCDYVCYPDEIEAFAKLVAAQTLMKIDPSSFMSYQEGFEAGQLAEREECAKMFKELQIVDEAKNDLGGCVFCGFTPKLARQAIRARGQE